MGPQRGGDEGASRSRAVSGIDTALVRYPSLWSGIF